VGLYVFERKLCPYIKNDQQKEGGAMQQKQLILSCAGSVLLVLASASYAADMTAEATTNPMPEVTASPPADAVATPAPEAASSAPTEATTKAPAAAPTDTATNPPPEQSMSAPAETPTASPYHARLT
jgi:hypothetical protein